MQYKNGTVINIYDKVIISGIYHGIVVADIDNDNYTESITKEEWSYLKSGILIDTDFAGLVHYKNLDNEIIEQES